MDCCLPGGGRSRGRGHAEGHAGRAAAWARAAGTAAGTDETTADDLGLICESDDGADTNSNSANEAAAAEVTT